MDWHNLPPHSALRAFAAFAEAGSFSGAGTLLNVSHAAIGQQVRRLEERLGVQLVEPSGRSVRLTTDGEALARVLTAAFAEIADAVEMLAARETRRPLQVTTTPMFATHWLMPRLADFTTFHPEVELMINPTPQLADPSPGGIDVAIRFGNGSWPGLEATMLVKTHFVIVGAPELVGNRGSCEPDDLLDLPWLQETGTNEVTEWLERQGISSDKTFRRIHLPGHLVLEGVRRGQGLAATTHIFVADDLESGDLVLLSEDVPAGTGYHLVTRPGVLRPAARAFATWARRQARVTD